MSADPTPTSLLDEEQERFLLFFRKRGLKLRACRKSGVTVYKVDKWLANDDSFATAYQYALDESTDRARNTVWKRGVKGYMEPLTHQGRLTGDEVRKYDSALLQMEVKRRDPKYTQRVEIDVKEIPIKLIRGVALEEIIGAPEPKALPESVDAIDAEEIENE